MVDPLVRKVDVKLTGGGPQDGERFELLESELQLGHAPYIEFALPEGHTTTKVKDYIHIYAATKAFKEGDVDISLEYAGWFNGLYDPFQEVTDEQAT